MPHDPHIFDLCGGNLALDLANTLGSRHTEHPVEHLTSYDRLVDFAVQSKILSAERGKRLAKWARSEPRMATSKLAHTRELREAVYRVFAAVARREALAEADLATINRWIARLHIGPALDWCWADGADAPDAFMAPVVRATVDLLTSEARDRVRICEAGDCVWLFFDGSKNRSRRWCDMNQCGNRVKARRHYERTRAPSK